MAVSSGMAESHLQVLTPHATLGVANGSAMKSKLKVPGRGGVQHPTLPDFPAAREDPPRSRGVWFATGVTVSKHSSRVRSVWFTTSIKRQLRVANRMGRAPRWTLANLIYRCGLVWRRCATIFAPRVRRVCVDELRGKFGAFVYEAIVAVAAAASFGCVVHGEHLRRSITLRIRRQRPIVTPRKKRGSLPTIACAEAYDDVFF